MATFLVNVTRVGYRTKVLRVQADTQGEADFKALEQAPDIDFTETNEHTSEYEIS